MNQLNRTLLQLSLISGVGPVSIAALIKAFPGNALLDLFPRLTAVELQQSTGITLRTASAIVAGMRDQHFLEREIADIEHFKVTIVTLFDDGYPELLRHIYAPPPVLWCQGDLTAFKMPAVSIVGSRAGNWYAKAVLSKFVPELVQAGFSMVSGGARGIDGWAHEETLNSGGSTIAVLGSGLGRLYPPEHYELFNRIAASHGMLLSIFPFQTPPSAGNFPARNRIIAGLSQACLVVQAAEKSGALLTARYAVEAGRDLFVVPGAITDPLTAGCHKLIGEGATVAYDVSVLLNELGVASHSEVSASAAQGAPLNCDQSLEQSLEYRLLSLCSNPSTIEFLTEQLAVSEQSVREVLFSLHIDGKVTQNHMGFWCRL